MITIEELTWIEAEAIEQRKRSLENLEIRYKHDDIDSSFARFVNKDAVEKADLILRLTQYIRELLSTIEKAYSR